MYWPSLASSILQNERSFFRRLTTDGVLWGLIMTNVAVFMLWNVADTKFMVKNFMISVENIKHGQLHTMITNAFSHRDAFHLFSNMVGLYFFGSSIGQTFGPQYLLKLYLGGAIAGSIFYLVYQAFIAPSVESKPGRLSHSQVPALGASAALNAIILLNILLYPTSTIYLEFFVPVPAYLVGVFLIGNDMWKVWKGNTEISGASHLGGAAAGALAWLSKRKGRFGRF
ncbi:RHOMBOID-like protein 12, mitochondrial isoform X2 [Salvia miltiorrhiza]|uniref:RHOMBOID-like protein 12, mitochondrial isoform X2 n=1 Tax=Salvia miltiorrhiza TaxID=226208 RepID=UPI0025AB6D30|nr:RHOMBOID-like protein 12, mitochondrial isoform X2 [Salvia miltiorrhiza]